MLCVTRAASVASAWEAIVSVTVTLPEGMFDRVSVPRLLLMVSCGSAPAPAVRLPVKLWLCYPDGKRLEATFNWPGFKANSYPRLKSTLQNKYPGVAWI